MNDDETKKSNLLLQLLHGSAGVSIRLAVEIAKRQITTEIVSEYIPTIYGVILESLREIGYYRVRAYSEWCPGGQ